MNTLLWAPWRIQYILGDKEKTQCVFCSIASMDEEQRKQRGVLAVCEHVYVVLNRYPFTSGHVLVIPHRHLGSIADLTEAENAELWSVTRETTVRLQKALRAQGMNVGMNLGEAAGAGIAEHIHVHVVPRWIGDSNFMPVIADTRVMPQYLEDTWRHLQPHFADLPGRRPPAP